jgi:hypothetical protein
VRSLDQALYQYDLWSCRKGNFGSIDRRSQGKHCKETQGEESRRDVWSRSFVIPPEHDMATPWSWSLVPRAMCLSFLIPHSVEPWQPLDINTQGQMCHQHGGSGAQA